MLVSVNIYFNRNNRKDILSFCIEDCVSNANGFANHFYMIEYLKSLDTTAANQAMGIDVINFFMVILPFIAILILLKIPS
jgi:hypothetical protein